MTVPLSNIKHKQENGRQTTRGSGIQSVERVLNILEQLRDAGGELTLSELSARTGLNSSTCHHLVSTLVERKYVSKSLRWGAYRLGSQVLTLAAAVDPQVDLLSRSDAVLAELNKATGETVHLAVLQGDELVTLLKRDALHAVRVDAGMVGKSNACHATATGKALLAWLADDDVVRIVAAGGLRAFTPKTICDLDTLHRELEAVRENGFAVDNEEFQAHVFCIGAPITDATGNVVASISASTPILRADGNYLEHIKAEVLSACRRLSVAAPVRGGMA